MPPVGTELRTGGAMRRVGTATVHGQIRTIVNAIWRRGNIQLPYFVVDPSPIHITYVTPNTD